jgi:hypothetical protein
MVGIVVLLSAVALFVGLGEDTASASPSVRRAKATGETADRAGRLLASTGPSAVGMLEPEITEIIGLA